VARVELNGDRLVIDIDLESITGQSMPRLQIVKPMRIKRRGVEMRLLIEEGNGPRTRDPTLIKTIARGARLVRCHRHTPRQIDLSNRSGGGS